MFFYVLAELRAKMKAGDSKREILFAMKDAATGILSFDLATWLHLLVDLVSYTTSIARDL